MLGDVAMQNMPRTDLHLGYVSLLVRHRKKLRCLNPDTEQTRTLQFVVETRRKFVSDKTRDSNRLTP
jgi:hypothetical protein